MSSSPPAALAPAPSPRHPMLWVPSLYFAMGIPNATVGIVAAIMYKNMGMPNEDIALYTSQMYLPWVLKPLWAPFLEPYRTKRFWVISMEFIMAAALGLLAFSLPLPSFVQLSLAFFWITGFASATQDIAADAVFMSSTTPAQQARFAGLQGMCWNGGAILASGVLVALTGTMHEGLGFSWAKSWMIVMSIIGASLALLGVWHLRTLPVGDVSPLRGGGFAGAARSLGATWASFFRKRDIGLMLAVCFFYRFGEGFIEKFGSLFLLDARAVGGLGLNNVAVGHIYGTVGTIGFIVGSFVGGFLAAKLTLRRAFFILALALNLPHVTYYVLALWMPVDPWVIGTIVTVEKFGFGVGAVGHMLYMMQQMSPGDFRMSHYAFATGVMALTKWFTGSISGWVYRLFGENYQHFFLFVLLASLPPLVFAWIAPFPQSASDDEKRPAAGH